jgi:hypothetical protein
MLDLKVKPEFRVKLDLLVQQERLDRKATREIKVTLVQLELVVR